LQQKVDALVRTLVGTAGVRRDGKVGEGVGKGLDHLMCADGFDVETGIHKVICLGSREYGFASLASLFVVYTHLVCTCDGGCISIVNFILLEYRDSKLSPGLFRVFAGSRALAQGCA
jgi:hypothetical protein